MIIYLSHPLVVQAAVYLPNKWNLQQVVFDLEN